MTVFRSRGEIINQTETVQLRASFYNMAGDLADTDSFPTIKIIEPSGNLVLGPTTAGVYRLSQGVFGFDYALGINASLGVWVDFWRGNLEGNVLTKELNFVVQNTQMPMVNGDGYESLGDNLPYKYSQIEIRNINKIMKVLRKRLNSMGKALSHDKFGNEIYVDCDIFQVEELTDFICDSLSMFNEIPYFTDFTFFDSDIIRVYLEVLVQGALIQALSSKALIEKGRESSVQDSGLSYSPSQVSDVLSAQYTTELADYKDKVRYIKNSMRPAVFSSGILTTSTGARLPIIRSDQLRKVGRIF